MARCTRCRGSGDEAYGSFGLLYRVCTYCGGSGRRRIRGPTRPGRRPAEPPPPCPDTTRA